ncbi:interleukin-21 receptor [Fundulus heteroclitus]|uniref:interleukin-21 receptor n=1 Tax=Fundulus heteroclitus TaxID=8078 RepID=UPI00165AD0FE|nr:interleukin-21 receptor [Fundulus heteroclitus]
MAPPPLSLSLLWGLALLIGGAAASFCNVTCNTDYENVLNCSCSGSVPALPVLLNVTCRHRTYDDIVEGSCEIQPPRSWCTIVKSLILVASVGTMCNTTASQPGSTNPSEMTSWELWNAVKLEPPVDVKVTNVTLPAFYNITWRSDYDDCVVSRVRIRNTEDPFQVPINVELEGDEEHFELNQEKLQPGASYVADIQVKYCKDAFYQGPWSEWSSGAEWSTARSPPDVEGMNSYWLYISTPIILVLALLLLGYLQKPCWQKKLRMITYIPRPNEYFKPLYQNYEGNFKDWVKPVFSEHDYLKISTCVPMPSEKQSDIFHWCNDKQSYSEDVEAKDGEGFTPQLPNNLLPHFQHSGASQGTLHSAGHVSIHTVTLSGEEFEGEVTSQSSLRSYQDGESFGSFDDTHREDAPYNSGDAQASRMDRHSGISLRENQLANDLIIENQNFQADGELNEERVSLDSFGSNEQSEDGYPHVDLDTIDSGFGECISPGASDSHSNSFPDHTHLNSNYVKQWMICSTIQEDGGNVSSELNGTQQL